MELAPNWCTILGQVWPNNDLVWLYLWPYSQGYCVDTQARIGPGL
jgi:hypothetical protein